MRKTGKASPRGAGKRRTATGRTLHIERLETRMLLTAAPQAWSSSDDLILTGHGAMCACPYCSGIGLEEIPLAEVATTGELAESNPLSSLPQLSSNPTASAKLFLDFDGHFESSWGSWRNVTTPVFDQDGDRSTFSNGELNTMREIWARVAEDYAPFNIDVTTIAPSSTSRVAHIAIGGSSSDWYGSNAGGVAYIGGFYNSAPNVGYVFPANLGNGNPRYVAEAASHEAGHLFGLQHQAVWNGSTLVDAYNSGDSNWAPIMGTGYYATRSTWFNGPTAAGPTAYQDDMAIIAGSNNAFGYRADDYGNTTATAAALPVSGDSATVSGIIGSANDRDVFWFATGGGTLSFQLNVAPFGANLDAVLELWNGVGSVIATAAPASSLGATLSATVGAGTYYVVARGMGDYGNVGQYTITGSLPSSVAVPEISLNVGGVNLADGGTLNFGTTTPGTAVTRTVTVVNEGSAVLNLTPLSTSLPAGFSLVSNLGSTALNPGQSTSFSVRLNATAAGSYSGTMQLLSNDADESPFDIVLVGTVASPEIGVTLDGGNLSDGQTVQFGTTSVGNPITRTFTVTNHGNATLTLGSISAASLPAGFSLASNLGSTSLAPGQSTTFAIRLSASAAGTYSGNFALANNDADENPFDLLLTGTVTAGTTAGPAAHYRFDETSGTQAADASGNGYHGTYVNQPALGQTGVNGGNNAVSLNGVNQYVALPSAPFANPTVSGYTLSFQTWFQAAPGTSGVILGQTGAGSTPGSSAPSGYVPVVQLGTDGKLRSSLFWHGSTASRLVSSGSQTYNDGQWHHVAVTYANGVEKLYIDGVAVGQQTASQTGYASNYSYFLGTGYTSGWTGGNGSWHFFGGKLDEASLFQRALTATEIADTYATGKPSDPPSDPPSNPTGGASAHYRFDETSGSTAADATGNGYHATYANQPNLTQAGISGGNTAVALNGSNQYVALPSGPFGNPNNASGYTLSFETWFQAAPGTSGVILSQTGAGATPGSGAPSGYVPVVQLGTDGKLRSSLFWHGSTAARLVSPGSTTYNDGQWHHVAVTYANGTETLYIDGVAVGQQTAAQRSYASNYSYFLGTGYTSGWTGGNGGWHFFNGKLDETLLYQRELTAHEVADAYASGKSTDPPGDTPQFTALYRFDETSGSTAADTSGNGYHATYANQPTLTQAGISGGNTAVTLNGASQYVALPSGPFGNANATSGYTLSFETWFQAAPGTSGVILGQTGAGATPGGGAPSGYVPVIQLGTDGKLRSSLFWHGSTAVRLVSPGSTTYNDGQWHHVAVTYGGGVETLYIDGVAVAQQTASLSSYSNSYSYFLGTGYTKSWTGGNGGWHFFNGKFDEAAIYQKTLTATEVAQRYAAGAATAAVVDDSSAINEVARAVAAEQTARSIRRAHDEALQALLSGRAPGLVKEAMLDLIARGR